MTAKRFRVNELVKYNYSDIGEYIDENHTDKPLRNDEVVELLNELHEENERLQKNPTVLILANQNYRKENEQLKAQLYCDDEEGVCNICKHHYLEKGKTYEKYYISKCKKGHEECSKMDLKYCDDFELKEGDV